MSESSSPSALAVETIWSVQNSVDGINSAYIIAIVLLAVILVILVAVAIFLAVGNSRVYAKRELEAAARLQGGAPLSQVDDTLANGGGSKEGGSQDGEEEEEYEEGDEGEGNHHQWGDYNNGNDQEMERR